MGYSTSLNKNQEFFLLTISLTSLFFLSPLASVILSFFLMIYRSSETNYIVLFSFFSCLSLSLINSGKVPENDLLNYQDRFFLVPQIPFLQYALLMGKEPIYFIYSYLLFYLTFGSFKLFLFITSFISYFLVSLSYIKIYKILNLSFKSIICCLLTFFLFSNLFSLSAHLIRQFLASSIVIIVLINIAYLNKQRLFLFLSGVLIHSSAIIFTPVYLLNKNSSKKRFSLLLITFSTIFLTITHGSKFFLNILPDIEFLKYPFARIAYRKVYVDLGDLGFLNYLVIVFNIIIFYLFSKVNWKTRILTFVSIIILLVTLSFYNDSEIPMRISFYAYLLLPLSIMYSYSLIKKSAFKEVIYLSFLIFIGLQFLFRLKFGSWTYESLDSLLIGILSFI